jgi:alpha-galactosidase
VFSWAREFYVSETKLQYGMHSFGSVRGVSGHVHNPFAGKPWAAVGTHTCVCYIAKLCCYMRFEFARGREAREVSPC